jgi:DNA repair exonuclease SbcCD ATPase subunit
MPTLEELEERITELERTLPALRREQIDTGPIEERLNALQQQVAEQQRRLSTQEQGIGALTRALTHQFNAMNTNINARFEAQTTAIRAQFENTNMPLARVVGIVDRQEKDIREIKADVGVIKAQVAEIRQDMTGLRQDMTGRFEQADRRSDTQEQILHQILERLPKQ